VARIVEYNTEMAIDILRWYKSKGIDAAVDAGFHPYSYPEYPYFSPDTIYICQLCDNELSDKALAQMTVHEMLEFEITHERVKCEGTRDPERILSIRAQVHEELLRRYPEYNEVLPEIRRVHGPHYQYFKKEAFGNG